MTREEREKAIEILEEVKDLDDSIYQYISAYNEALDMAIEALKQGAPIDKSAMMLEIYMKGVNMAGEYQGCWVRFKDIEKIVDKHIAESENNW